MRIATSLYSQRLTQQLKTLDQSQQTLQKQLASGQRVETAADDPVAAAKLLQSREAQSTLIQNRRNATQAETLSKLGSQDLEYFREMAGRASGYVTDSNGDHALAAQQIDAMISDLLSVANTRHNGEYLHGGDASDAEPFTAATDANGDITGVTYNGTGDGRAYTVAQGVQLSPFTDDAANQNLAGTLNELVALRDALRTGDEAAITAASDAVDTREDALVTSHADIENNLIRIDVLRVREEASFSRLDETMTEEITADQTETITRLLATQNAFEAALQSTSKIMQLNLLNYL